MLEVEKWSCEDLVAWSKINFDLPLNDCYDFLLMDPKLTGKVIITSSEEELRNLVKNNYPPFVFNTLKKSK